MTPDNGAKTKQNPAKRQRITLKDIAQKSGVSPGAVSMALANSTQIGAETRERVVRIAKELGYRPRGLKSANGRRKGINRIGFLLVGDDLNEPVNLGLLQGLSVCTQHHGARVEFRSIAQDASEETILKETLRFCKEIEGLLISGTITSAFLKDLWSRNIRCVTIGHVLRQGLEAPGPERQIVSCDEWSEGRDATAHLLKLGHTRIAFVTDALVPGMRHENWLAGYVSALAIAKLPVAAELIQASFKPFTDILPSVQRLMKLPKPPTAFVIPDARGGRELVDALANLGISVGPESIVLGGDVNTIRLQRVGHLPHILQDVDRIAEQAVDQLLWLSQNRPSGGTEILVPSVYENF